MHLKYNSPEVIKLWRRASTQNILKYQSIIVDFKSPFKRAGPNFVANLPIAFPSSEIGRELRNKVRKYISMFELRL
jgi:hypothetical protein